ncbi:GntP family permease [Lacrimispora sp. 210928-DFI.3.58]|uniref:GntP family permease n=1 Tax=Lacrimispora sp. 210928-DFI.3.58 TaxID=2883214 RepID=UPI001D065B53|nr:GntP family permease [Lacrimispora sp. 210928-DFI.3.58]MCB7317983.1 GntP family permease [Lacrimispora sp. 210928-DFI.3.58]
MLSAIGLIAAIVLLVVMIIKGIDMITATVITALVILVTSSLNIFDGFLTTYSAGAGGFVASWFLILGLGGVFGQLVLETGLATKVAKFLTDKLGAKLVGLVILLCTFFITLLGINGYIMVFVLYPIADNLLRENGMDRRVLPFMLLGGGACGNGFMYSLDICNVLPNSYLGTSLGSAPGLSVICTGILAASFFLYFNYAQKKSRSQHTKEELLAMYTDNASVIPDEELPGIAMAVLPFVAVLAAVVATSSWGTSTSILFSLTLGILLVIVTQYRRIKNVKIAIKTGSSSGLNSMLTVAAVMGLSKVLGLSPAFQSLQEAVLSMNIPAYIKAYFGTAVLTGLTGSAISGETIFLESFGQAFLDMGVDAGALHRIVTEAALILNKLPNSSVAILTMSICGCSLKESYKHIILGTTIPAAVAGLAAALLATAGLIF